MTAHSAAPRAPSRDGGGCRETPRERPSPCVAADEEAALTTGLPPAAVAGADGESLQAQLHLQALSPSNHYTDAECGRFREEELKVREINRRAQLAGVTASLTEQPAAPPDGRSAAGAARAKGRYSRLRGLLTSPHRAVFSDTPGKPGETSDGLANDLFLSHCWRDENTQELKRMLVTELSRVAAGGEPGMTYWADFLDLFAEGPMPWRYEIEQAIKTSAKFVAFIDHHFLYSYNCLMELAIAIRAKKPVIPVIIQDKAWVVLTNPLAADLVWEGSASLRGYEGSTMGEKMPPFGLAELRKIFHHVASINFCACRPKDFASFGHSKVVHSFLADVKKDIFYLKEHTELSRRAAKWGVDKPRHLLLQGEEVSDWVKWVEQAERHHQNPPSTEQQKEFVQMSRASQSTRRRWLVVMSVVVALLILLGAVCSGIMAVWATHEANRADLEAAAADVARLAAEEAAAEAQKQKARAEEQEAIAIAEKQEVLVWNLLYKGHEVMEADSHLALRLLRRALQILQRSGSKALQAEALAFMRALLGPGRQAACVGKMQKDKSGMQDLSFDPSGQMLASPNEKDVLIWEVYGSNPTPWTLSHHESIVTATAWAISVDMLLLASGDGSGLIVLWAQNEQGTGWEAFQTLQGHTNDVRILSFSPVFQVLCSSSKDDSVWLWSGWDSDNVTHQVIQDNESASSAIWRPDGLAVSTRFSNTIKIWDVTDPMTAPNEPMQTIQLEDSSLRMLGTQAYSPDGTRMAVPLYTQDTAVVNLTTGALEFIVPALPGGGPTDPRGRSYWYPDTPGAILDGGHLILQATSGNDVLIGRQSHGGVWIDGRDITALNNFIPAIVPSPDGQWVAITSRRGVIQLCNLLDLTSGCMERNYGTAGPRDMAWVGEEVRFIARDGTSTPQGVAASPLQPDATEVATVWATNGTAYGLPLEQAISAHRRHSWTGDGLRFAYASETKFGTMGLVTFDEDGNNSHVFLTDEDNQELGLIRTPSISPGGEMLLGCYNRWAGTFVSLFNLTSKTSTFTKISSTEDGAVSSAVWSPVELCVALTPPDPGIHIYCVTEDGSLEFQQQISWGIPRCLAWSPDGRQIASGKATGDIEVWEDIREGAGDFRVLKNFVEASVTAIAYTPDGLQIVYGLENGQVRIRYVMGAPDTWLLLRGHTTQIEQMTLVCGHRNLIASGDLAGGIRVWDAAPYHRAGVADFEGHTSWLYGVAFSPQGGLLASASKDGSLRVWDHYKTKRQPWDAKVFPDHNSWILSLAWAEDSQDTGLWAVAAGCDDGSVWVHVSSADGSLESKQLTGHTEKVTFVEWPSLDSRLVSISYDGTIRLWLPMEPGSTPMVLSADAGAVLTARCHPFGGSLAAGYLDGSVRVWLTTEGLSVTGQTVQDLFDHSGAVMALSYSPDGHMLATASKDGTLRLYAAPAGGYASLDRVIASHDGPVSSLAFSPDSKSIVSGGWDGAVFLHGLHTKTTMELKGAQGLVGHVAFSPNGDWVAAASDGSGHNTPRGPLTLWDVADENNTQVHVLEDHGIARVASVAFSPDSSRVAYGTNKYTIRVTEQLTPEMALGRIEGIMVGDMTLHPEELLRIGLPSQVLE